MLRIEKSNEELTIDDLFQPKEQDSSILILRANRKDIDITLSKLGLDRKVNETRVRSEYDSFSLDIDDDIIQIVHVTEAKHNHIACFMDANSQSVSLTYKRFIETLSESKMHPFGYLVDVHGGIVETNSFGEPRESVELQKVVEFSLRDEQRILQLAVAPTNNSALYETALKYKDMMQDNGMNIGVIAYVVGLAEIEMNYIKSISSHLPKEQASKRLEAATLAARVQEQIFELADTIVVNSELEKYLVQEFSDGRFSAKVHSIKPALDWPYDVDEVVLDVIEKSSDEFRNFVDCSTQQKTFSFIGDLSVYGGLDVVLEAYYLTKRKHPDIYLNLSGNYDTNELSYAFQTIERKGLVAQGISKTIGLELEDHKIVDGIKLIIDSQWDGQMIISLGDFTIVPRTGSYFNDSMIYTMRLGKPLICHDLDRIESNSAVSSEKIAFEYANSLLPEPHALSRMMEYCLNNPDACSLVTSSASAFMQSNWNNTKLEGSEYQSVYTGVMPFLNAHSLQLKVKRKILNSQESI